MRSCDGQNGQPNLPQGKASLEYRITDAPAFPSAASIVIEGNVWHDMERAVLFIPPSTLAQRQNYAKYSYLPVQAVPQGMTNPDLIADVLDSHGELLTTLHFCSIWHKVQRNNRPWRWERISFRSLEDLAHYYQVIPDTLDRLNVCPSCRRLHFLYHFSCPFLDPVSLDEALTTTGLALRVHGGEVYLVSWNPYAPLYGGRWHGKIVWHAITRVHGLQAYDQLPCMFVEMEAGKCFLSARNVPLNEGWIAVDERPNIFLS